MTRLTLLLLSPLFHTVIATFSLNYASSNELAGMGIRLSVGTPRQEVGLLISVNDDEIFIAGPAACSSCSSQLGGQFDPSISSTWDPTAEVPIGDAGGFNWWNGSQVNYTLGYEEGEFTSAPAGNTSLSDLGMEIAVLNQPSPDNWQPPQNTLGLGNNSRFLDSLVNKGIIGARAFGVSAGSLDIGGFNESRVIGQRHPYPIIKNTGYLGGLQVTVVDMKIGEESLMTRTSGPFNATLGLSSGRPNYVPQVVMEDFLNITGGQAASSDTHDTPGWDSSKTLITNFVINVTLSNGATLLVPSYLLKIPVIGPQQSQFSMSTLLGIDELDEKVKVDNPGVQAIFGLSFVAPYNYLYVDWDREVFELADSNEGTEIIESTSTSSARLVQANVHTAWALVLLSAAVVAVLF